MCRPEMWTRPVPQACRRDGRRRRRRGDVGLDGAERWLGRGLERRDGPQRAARGAAGGHEDERKGGGEEGCVAGRVAVHRLGSLAVVICLGSSSSSFAIGSRPGNGRVTGRRSSTRRPPPSRLLAASSPPSSVACSAAIARPRPLLPPWRDGRPPEAVVKVASCSAKCPDRDRRRRPYEARHARRRPRPAPPRAPSRCRVADDPSSGGANSRTTTIRRHRAISPPRRRAVLVVTSSTRSTERRGRSGAGVSRSPSGRRRGGSQPGDVATGLFPAPAAPGAPGPRRIDASATSAASGVRSSCETSATNRRLWDWAASSRPIVSSSDAAIRLNVSAQSPNSSADATGTRAERSPRSIRSAARDACSTGARTPRATALAATSAITMRTSVPAISPARRAPARLIGVVDE